MGRPAVGNVQARGKGVWRIRATAPDGSRISRTVRGSRDDAQAVLTALLAAPILPSMEARATLSEFLEAWWTIKRPTLAPNTVPSWESALRLYILPQLGWIRLRDLKPADVEEVLIPQLREVPLGRDRIRSIVMVLAVALKSAVRRDLIPSNPAAGIIVEGTQKYRPRSKAPAPEGVRALLHVARRDDPEMYAILMVACDAGLRRGEIAALRWSDVDFSRSSIIVRSAVSKGGGSGAVVRQTKGDDATSLALSAPTMAALAERLEVVEEITGDNVHEDWYVFGERMDQPMYPDTITKRFSEIRQAAELPSVQFRSLRHFPATQLLAAGRSVRDVQHRQRHGRASTTLDYYSDHIPASDHAAASMMGDLLAG